MHIDLLTAKPALELMLASNGHEAPYPDIRAVWAVFLKYLAVPADASRDAACFQAHFLDAEGEEKEASCIFIFARQLTGEDGETRCVQLHYDLRDRYTGRIDDFDIWSSDFTDLASFAGAVERSPHFRLLCEDSGPVGEMFVELSD
jgi:hypothetical protein